PKLQPEDLGGALALVVGCGGVSIGENDVRVTVQARYEKRDLGAGGFGSLTPRPARFAYAEALDPSGNLIDRTYLGSDGSGPLYVPQGSPFRVKLLAQVEVPSSSSSDFMLRGSVKRALIPTDPETGAILPYTSLGSFNDRPNWSTTSDLVEANTSGTLTVTALESTSEAGAFAIADQMVTFAQKVQALEPGLRLPDLHAFWHASGSDATYSTYPAAAWVQSGGGEALLKQDSGRTVFHHEVRWADPAAADRGADAYNDGVLQEVFARLLFADYSLQSKDNAGKDEPWAIIRRDSDNVYADPSGTTALEPTLAWTAGFATFLGSAFRNDPTLREVASNG
ncbi:MAG TPA: hypothetical protein PKO12_12195, partial [Holophaga sp.]|nr:hypothetical protein [Holophaga sp.]